MSVRSVVFDILQPKNRGISRGSGTIKRITAIKAAGDVLLHATKSRASFQEALIMYIARSPHDRQAPSSIPGWSRDGWIVSFQPCPMSTHQGMGTGRQQWVMSHHPGLCGCGVMSQVYPSIYP